MELIETIRIWDLTCIGDREATRMEFPHLIRFKGHWYCAFREGDIHMNHPSGRGRIIRSSDGRKWETAALLEWDCGDVREVRLSVTAENHLMANTSVYFVSREPRGFGYSSRGAAYAQHYQVAPGTPADDDECNVARQSVTWLSPDGRQWSGAYACPSGINNWRWDVTWSRGMGYSVGYAGRDAEGKLYRTRDGKNWRVLKDGFFPEGRGNEASLAFAPDGTAYCLLRGGPSRAMLGIGQAPSYQDWQWKSTSVVVDDDQGVRTVARSDDSLGSDLGGPKLLRLRDGRLLAAGRNAGRINLFWVDPDMGTLAQCMELDGTSYPGLAEDAGEIWVTYGVSEASEIKLARLKSVDV